MAIQNSFETFTSWFLAHGLRIILILAAALLLDYFLRTFIEKGVNKKLKNKIDGDRKKRVKTLISVFGGTLSFLIWITAILMVLPEFGVNITPILAGLGLLGLAVGMAARDIISDFISGIFILLEGQYYVGDRVKISGIEGEVKEITLRRTTIKDEAGLFHSFPNSQIKFVSKKEK